MFGWIISSNRTGNRFTKLLEQKRFLSYGVIGCLWIGCAFCLLVPVYLVNSCFEVDFENIEINSNAQPNPEAMWDGIRDTF